MIEPSAHICRRFVVDDARAITFMGPELRVYGTPNMLYDVEMTCRDLLLPMLEPGQDSVGATADIVHLGPALLHAEVDVDVRIAAVADRRVTFEASVSTGGAVIGTVRHERAVVNVGRLKTRLRALQDAAPPRAGA